MFHRQPEKEYRHLYKKYGISTTTYSSLLFGILTGKVSIVFFDHRYAHYSPP